MNHSSEPIGSLGNFLNFKWRQRRAFFGDFDVAHRVQLFGYNDKNSITYRFNCWMGSAVSCRLTTSFWYDRQVDGNSFLFFIFLPRLV